MSINVSVHENHARITVSDPFSFPIHREFRKACDEVLDKKNVSEISVDLGTVRYMDSAALGMLLVLRERAVSQGASVLLDNCAGMVRQVLEIANFQKLFDIR